VAFHWCYQWFCPLSAIAANGQMLIVSSLQIPHSSSWGNIAVNGNVTTLISFALDGFPPAGTAKWSEGRIRGIYVTGLTEM
jgi:hypothetical protein